VGTLNARPVKMADDTRAHVRRHGSAPRLGPPLAHLPTGTKGVDGSDDPRGKGYDPSA
jgi:hypothetical protein